MKVSIKKIVLFVIPLFLGAMFINSCTHDDEAGTIIPPSTFEYGKTKVSSDIGFNFDHTHSSVRWETSYLGIAALLTGRFNDFGLDITFDEDNPDNTSFSGYVILSSVNTGEPGRDAGCLLGTFDVATSDSAYFTSTAVDKDGKGGYTFMGDLTFHGVTSSIDGTLQYLGTTHFDEASGMRGAPLNVTGFVAQFEFNAKTVFGIESGNIADAVLITASGQFKQPL